MKCIEDTRICGECDTDGQVTIWSVQWSAWKWSDL